MKNLIKTSVTSLLLLSPSLVLADKFDITMDVVGAEESFDEVIVNRIALPFTQSSSKALDAQNSRSADGLLDQLGDIAVDDPIGSSDVGSTMALEQMMQVENLPALREGVRGLLEK